MAAKKKGLGRGLDALLGGDSNTTMASASVTDISQAPSSPEAE